MMSPSRCGVSYQWAAYLHYELEAIVKRMEMVVQYSSYNPFTE